MFLDNNNKNPAEEANENIVSMIDKSHYFF